MIGRPAGLSRLGLLSALLLLCTATVFAAFVPPTAVRDVEVEVTATWNTTEIWAEGHAFFESVSPALGRSYIDHITSAACPSSVFSSLSDAHGSPTAESPLSDARQYTLALSAADALLGPYSRQLLPFALNFSLHSPRVEAARETFITTLQRWVGVGDLAAPPLGQATSTAPVSAEAFRRVLACPVVVATGRRLACAASPAEAVALPALLAAAVNDLVATSPLTGDATAALAAVPSELLLAPQVSFDVPFTAALASPDVPVLPVVVYADAASAPCATARALAALTATAPPAGSASGVAFTPRVIFRSRTLAVLDSAAAAASSSSSPLAPATVSAASFPGYCRDRLRATASGPAGADAAGVTTWCLRYSNAANPGTLAGVTAQTVLGYGAELAVKSTEYTVVDKTAAAAAADAAATTAAAAAAAAAGSTADGDALAAGFGRGHVELRAHFAAALAALPPAARAAAEATWAASLPVALTSAGARDGAAWAAAASSAAAAPDAVSPVAGGASAQAQLDSLSARTATVVLAAADPLRALAHTAERFPALFSVLLNGTAANAGVAEALRVNTARLQDALARDIAESAAAGGMDPMRAQMVAAARGVGASIWVAGQPVRPDRLNPFDLAPLLLREARLLDQAAAALSAGAPLLVADAELLTVVPPTPPAEERTVNWATVSGWRLDLLAAADAVAAARVRAVVTQCPAAAAAAAGAPVTAAGAGAAAAATASRLGPLAVSWLGDLASDPRYGSYPPWKQALMTPAHPGSVLPARANLHEAVIVADVGTLGGAATAVAGAAFTNTRAPVRIGVLAITAEDLVAAEENDDSNDELSPAQLIVRCWHALAAAAPPASAASSAGAAPARVSGSPNPAYNAGALVLASAFIDKIFDAARLSPQNPRYDRTWTDADGKPPVSVADVKKAFRSVAKRAVPGAVSTDEIDSVWQDITAFRVRPAPATEFTSASDFFLSLSAAGACPTGKAAAVVPVPGSKSFGSAEHAAQWRAALLDAVATVHASGLLDGAEPAYATAARAQLTDARAHAGMGDDSAAQAVVNALRPLTNRSGVGAVSSYLPALAINGVLHPWAPLANPRDVVIFALLGSQAAWQQHAFSPAGANLPADPEALDARAAARSFAPTATAARANTRVTGASASAGAGTASSAAAGSTAGGYAAAAETCNALAAAPGGPVGAADWAALPWLDATTVASAPAGLSAVLLFDASSVPSVAAARAALAALPGAGPVDAAAAAGTTAELMRLSGAFAAPAADSDAGDDDAAALAAAAARAAAARTRVAVIPISAPTTSAVSSAVVAAALAAAPTRAAAAVVLAALESALRAEPPAPVAAAMSAALAAAGVPASAASAAVLAAAATAPRATASAAVAAKLAAAAGVVARSASSSVGSAVLYVNARAVTVSLPVLSSPLARWVLAADVALLAAHARVYSPVPALAARIHAAADARATAGVAAPGASDRALALGCLLTAARAHEWTSGGAGGEGSMAESPLNRRPPAQGSDEHGIPLDRPVPLGELDARAVIVPTTAAATAAAAVAAAAPLATVTAYLSPLAPTTQTVASFLVYLRDSLGLPLTVALLPARPNDDADDHGHARPPIRRFYRSASAAPLPRFSPLTGARLPPAPATFFGLSTDALLTLTVHTPEPWLLSLAEAEDDLDNLRLATAAGAGASTSAGAGISHAYEGAFLGSLSRQALPSALVTAANFAAVTDEITVDVSATGTLSAPAATGSTGAGSAYCAAVVAAVARALPVSALPPVRARYTLAKVIIAGQAVEGGARPAAAAGVQLTAEAPAVVVAASTLPAGALPATNATVSPAVAATIVMENLGYFQLQARPGVFDIAVARNGHHKVFAVDAAASRKDTASGAGSGSAVSAAAVAELSTSLRGARTTSSAPTAGTTDAPAPKAAVIVIGAAPARSNALSVAVTSFTASPETLSLRRLPGQGFTRIETVELSESSPTAGAAQSLQLLQSWSSPTMQRTENRDTIHVFSIASGHLYERFLRIMMLSVKRATKSKVKFWFIDNFLSPQFKAFAPRMAAEYGYEVAFVTYKWPAWLRGQEQKQRLIWGYKILFLDVIFPLDLDRVVFVDADQVVRGDLKELFDLKLKSGAPYAYTPFCDNNKETEGFRFWKQGYWLSHLRGKPYHISALYLIDLRQFRRMRAGDQLRAVYDQLSGDKHSLANLDQDLPNYAQHEVPIHSLPQEWLWCETWCGEATLPRAKTIDLCNNPQTKAPKLDVARRLIPEWAQLDTEADALYDRFLAEQQQQAVATP